ncbi:MAG: hypothetical protein HYW02_03895, partial [Deltaproteobacteria bacterium]|nr:hypothetical protein [Deltaproteobacteria bacterium]
PKTAPALEGEVIENLGSGMARVRVQNAAGQNYSYVVVQYAATGNGDGKADGHDACPLDATATCDGVCVPGAPTVLSAETNPATQVARRRANVNEQCADYDDDNLCDGEEDLDDNCLYNRPEEGEASRETDWRNSDTDGDAALRYEGGGPSTGIDSIDECPHFAPSEVGYPDCRRFYCDRSFPDRIRFKHTAGVDTDDDGITDIHEDPDQDCQANPDNADLNILHLDPFDPDTDGDGFSDGEDQCPGVPNATQDMEDITFCGYDNIGGNAGPFNHCVPDSAHPIWAGADGKEDSDRDGIPNVQEDSNGNCSLDEFESNPFLRDTDGDGMRDDEDACPWSSDIYCVRRCIANQYVDGKDSDGDGLKDVEEDRNQNCHYFGESENVTGETEPWDTNPFLRDSDGDGINDKVDGCQATDPGLLFSRNADGRPDASNEELECARSQCIEGNGRDPGALKDSDGDFIPDVKEDLDNDCLRTSASGETDRFDSDTDDDGILDGIEDINRNGVKDTNETDPRYTDTDGDGISDGVEDYNQNGRVDLGELDPKKADSDGDTIPDNIEDRDHDGLWDASVNGQSVPLTGPCRADGNGGNPETSGYLADSDLDGISDNLEDLNGNGQFTDIGKKYAEGIEEAINEITQGIGVKEFGETHPCDEDTDNDGLHDGQEDKNKNGAFEPKEGETSPLSPHTFGEPDMSRLERRLGISGCSLIR